MSLHKKMEYSKGLFMYRVLNYEAPEYISNIYTRPPPPLSSPPHPTSIQAGLALGTVNLVCLGQG